MAYSRLLFRGHGLPVARITGFSGTQVITAIKTKNWSADTPSALWRTFSEIDLLNDWQLEKQWITPYGDVMHSRAEPEGTRHTVSEWRPLHAALKTAASAWQTGSDGRDCVDKDSAEYAAAVFALQQVPSPRVIMRGGLVPEADSLADFLHISCAFQLEARTPLRRCLQCRTWFDASHRAALFCSPACRVAHHRSTQEKKKNG